MKTTLTAGRFTTVAIALAAIFMFGLPIMHPGVAKAIDESNVGPSAAPPLAPDAMRVVPVEAVTPRPRPRARARKPSSRTQPFQVEPANARLRIKENTWIYTRPSFRASHIKRGTAGKYVIVTGSTRYYLRVRLESGKTGYILQRAVYLVAPTNKYFKLTHDSPVLEKPNRWAKKLSEVHRGYYVHVIGVALNYMQIKMKSGLVGFIHVTALQ